MESDGYGIEAKVDQKPEWTRTAMERGAESDKVTQVSTLKERVA